MAIIATIEVRERASEPTARSMTLEPEDMDTYLKKETHKAMAFDGVKRETVKIAVLDTLRDSDGRLRMFGIAAMPSSPW